MARMKRLITKYKYELWMVFWGVCIVNGILGITVNNPGNLWWVVYPISMIGAPFSIWINLRNLDLEISQTDKYGVD